MALKLRLSSAVYSIENYEKGENPPLTGNITISAPSGPALATVREVYISFLQSITCKDPSQSTSRQLLSNPRAILCPSLLGSTTSTHNSEYNSQQFIGGTTLLVPPTSEQQPSLKLPFAIDVPPNTPATTSTQLGNIAYTLVATATTSQHETITDSQPVKITRHTVQRDVEKTQLSIFFPNSTAVEGMTLLQNPTPRSGPRFSFTATIRPRWDVIRGDRCTESKHFVVRELKWYAEETVKIMARPGAHQNEPYSICEQLLTRKLCAGNTKGYWGLDQNPNVRHPSQHLVTREDGKTEIRVSFEFTIPKQELVVDDIGFDAYQFRQKGLAEPSLSCHMLSEEPIRVITVQHQLKVEVVTGEDTFHTDTGKLVERKPLKVTVCPAFPLSVCEVST